MSRILLPVFGAYRILSDGQVEQAKPGRLSSSQLPILQTNPGGGYDIPFDAVPLPGGKKVPGYLVALFGMRDALDETHRRRKQAREAGVAFVYAELVVEVSYPNGLMYRRHETVEKNGKPLEHEGFDDGFTLASVKRMAADVQLEILEHFKTVLRARGMPAKEIDALKVKGIAEHFDLWPDVIALDSDLRRLDVLVIPVKDPDVPGGIRQVALVKPGAKIVEVKQLSERDRLII